MIAAAARSCGIPSEVLPKQTDEDMALGRKYTSSKECFPMICTTGSFLKKLMEPGADPSKISFFMPDHNGPCSFGQYNQFHRILFDRLGYKEAELITPSNDTSYAGCCRRTWSEIQNQCMERIYCCRLPAENLPGDKTI